MHIEQTTLPGGLTVVTANLPDYESAAFVVAVRAGSRDETTANTGVAHFLEHMAFKGTRTRSAFDIAVTVECLGAQINAFTNQEMTVYHITGLRDAAADALEILGDILTASRFAMDDVLIERAVIAQEIAQGNDDPHTLCIEGLLATAYREQPMGRPIIGAPAVVAALTDTDLRAFVNRHYSASNIVIVATGNIAHAWALEAATRHFAVLPSADPPARRVAPSYDGGYHRHTRADFQQVNISMGFPSVAMDAPDFFAHKMLAAALGGGMASPLFQEVRNKRGLVYYVGAGAHNGADAGLFLIQAGTTPDKLAEFFTVAGAEAVRIGGAVEERDHLRARNLFLAELAVVKERPAQLAFYLANQVFRRGEATGPDIDLAAVRAVTVDDLRRAAAVIFKTPPTLSLVGPIDDADYPGMLRSALAG